MGARVLILGAGFGGIAAATELRSQIGPEHEITLIDRRDSFMMGLRKLWIMVGECGPDEGRRPTSALAQDGLRVVRTAVNRIDLQGRTVGTEDGEFAWDYLVVALGADLRPDLIPGLSEHGHNLYDADAATGLAEAVVRFAGGRILLAVAGAPYKCPPAPYEAAMLLDTYLRKRGLRDATELSMVVPMPIAMPNAGPEGSAVMVAALSARGIDLQTGQRLTGVQAGKALFAGGERAFDLLIAVPPHRCPAVVAEAGLTGGGDWVQVDPQTLRTSHPRVYAVGDVTQIPLSNGLPLPKAGIMAERQGQRVANGIAAELNGWDQPAPFSGTGMCFIEMGGGLAARMEGDFFATPSPRIAMAAPAPEHMEAKRAFERERLTRWFGA